MANFDKVAESAFNLAQKREAAIILTQHGPIAVSTNTRDFKRARPEQILGVYNDYVSYKWITDDLKAQLNNAE